MKKILYIALTAATALASMTSCDRENLTYEFPDKQGTLDLSSFGAVSDEGVKEVAQMPVSRAVDTQDFTVQIFNAATDVIENDWKYKETPEVVILNVGNYNLKVFSHNVQPAEWETPYYYAERAFTIEENKVTHMDTVVCTLQNIKVTVAFSEDLKTFMGNDCKVAVTVGSGSLDYTKEEIRAGYFRADDAENQLIALFTGTIDGAKETVPIRVNNVKAGEWRKIRYDIKRPEPSDEVGGITPNVIINATCEIIDHNGNVTVDEEVIVDPNPIDPEDPGTGGEDPDQPVDPGTNAPTISSPTLQLNTPVVITEGLQVVIDITSQDDNGLTALVVDIKSPTLTQETLIGVGLDSHLDLVNPGSLKEGMEGLGFPTGDNVLNQKKVQFDISQFAPLLGALGAGTHEFVIQATDAQGTTTESLILVTE